MAKLERQVDVFVLFTKFPASILM